jgi:hypothetical protein
VIKISIPLACALLLICILFAPAGLRAQEEQQPRTLDEDSYGTKFFDQLRSIFGRFRDADLRRAFQAAEPVQCSELVINKGEWRTVAFFNEDRSLGEWCRNSIEEVKTDLSVYLFKGSCKGDQGPVQLSTEFPIGDSIDAYNAGRISLDQIDINVNKPVTASWDITAQAYRFDLPYLFLVGRRNTGNIYSLIAPNRNSSYAPDVANRWECKAVKSNDVTYRFLICKTYTVNRGAEGKNRNRDMSFGATAYFILSDGIEAQTSVSISFGEAGRPAGDPQAKASTGSADARPPALPADKVPATGSWQVPDTRSRLVELAKNEFRLRFSPQTWTGKIASDEVLTDLKLLSSRSARPAQGTDYCTWSPGAANLAARLLAGTPDPDIAYSLMALDRNSQSAASILFDITNRSGDGLGTLQCFFPGVQSAASVTFDSWVSIVGAHIALEIRK